MTDTNKQLPPNPLEAILNLIEYYAATIEALQYSILLFPHLQDDIMNELELFANKYIDSIDDFLKAYEEEKKNNVVISLEMSKYYRELKEHKKRGYIL